MDKQSFCRAHFTSSLNVGFGNEPVKERLDWSPDNGDSFREQVISGFISLFSEVELSFHAFDRSKPKRVGIDG